MNNPKMVPPVLSLNLMPRPPHAPDTPQPSTSVIDTWATHHPPRLPLPPVLPRVALTSVLRSPPSPPHERLPRSAAHSAAAGLGSSSGAVLKTARERRYPSYAGPGGGGRIPGSASGDSQHPLADVRERAAALSSYYPVSSVATIPASFTPAAPPAESRGQPGAGRRPASQPPPPRPSRRTFGLGGPHRGAAGAIAATPAAAAASASASYSAAAAGSTGPSFGSFDRFGVRLSAAATPSGARFDEADSDLEPLEMIAGHDDFGSRSEWDDVLAAVSMPHQAAEESADDSRD